MAVDEMYNIGNVYACTASVWLEWNSEESLTFHIEVVTNGGHTQNNFVELNILHSTSCSVYTIIIC